MQTQAIEFVNLVETVDKMNTLADGVQGPIIKEGFESPLEDFVKVTSRRAPVWEGTLKRSISGVVEMDSANVEAVYRVAAKHSAHAEFGTDGPRFVPKQHIGKWAKDHGFGNSGIIVSGRARPFVRRNVSEPLSAAARRLAKDCRDGVAENINRVLSA